MATITLKKYAILVKNCFRNCNLPMGIVHVTHGDGAFTVLHAANFKVLRTQINKYPPETFGYLTSHDRACQVKSGKVEYRRIYMAFKNIYNYAYFYALLLDYVMPSFHELLMYNQKVPRVIRLYADFDYKVLDPQNIPTHPTAYSDKILSAVYKYLYNMCYIKCEKEAFTQRYKLNWQQANCTTKLSYHMTVTPREYIGGHFAKMSEITALPKTQKELWKYVSYTIPELNNWFDLEVYNKNHTIRTVYSTKPGANRPLKPLSMVRAKSGTCKNKQDIPFFAKLYTIIEHSIQTYNAPLMVRMYNTALPKELIDAIEEVEAEEDGTSAQQPTALHKEQVIKYLDSIAPQMFDTARINELVKSGKLPKNPHDSRRTPYKFQSVLSAIIGRKPAAEYIAALYNKMRPGIGLGTYWNESSLLNVNPYKPIINYFTRGKLLKPLDLPPFKSSIIDKNNTGIPIAINPGDFAESYQIDEPALNAKHYEDFINGPHRILCIESPCKTGKTSTLLRLVTERFPDKRIMFMTYRKSLALNVYGTSQKNNWGFKLYDEITKADNPDRLICQVESSHKIGGNKYDIVIFDECDHVLSQYDSQTTFGNVKNKMTLERVFEYNLLQAPKVIFMSATMTHRTVEILQTYNVPIEKCGLYIRNTYKSLENVRYYRGYGIEPCLTAIVQRISHHKRLLVITGTEKNSLKIKHMINKLFSHHKVAIYTGKSNYDPNDLMNINDTWIKYDVVIYNTAVEAGVSFEKAHFDEVIACVDYKAIRSDSIFQQMFRDRTNVKTSYYLLTRCNTELNAIYNYKDVQQSLNEIKHMGEICSPARKRQAINLVYNHHLSANKSYIEYFIKRNGGKVIDIQSFKRCTDKIEELSPEYEADLEFEFPQLYSIMSASKDLNKLAGALNPSDEHIKAYIKRARDILALDANIAARKQYTALMRAVSTLKSLYGTLTRYDRHIIQYIRLALVRLFNRNANLINKSERKNATIKEIFIVPEKYIHEPKYAQTPQWNIIRNHELLNKEVADIKWKELLEYDNIETLGYIGEYFNKKIDIWLPDDELREKGNEVIKAARAQFASKHPSEVKTIIDRRNMMEEWLKNGECPEPNPDLKTVDIELEKARVIYEILYYIYDEIDARSVKGMSTPEDFARDSFKTLLTDILVGYNDIINNLFKYKHKKNWIEAAEWYDSSLKRMMEYLRAPLKYFGYKLYMVKKNRIPNNNLYSIK